MHMTNKSVSEEKKNRCQLTARVLVWFLIECWL